MRNVFLWIAMGSGLGLFGYGCASAADEQRRAVKYSYLAERAAMQGDYKRAADEQNKADEARKKAKQKAEKPPSLAPPPSALQLESREESAASDGISKR